MLDDDDAAVWCQLLFRLHEPINALLCVPQFMDGEHSDDNLRSWNMAGPMIEVARKGMRRGRMQMSSTLNRCFGHRFRIVVIEYIPRLRLEFFAQ